VATKFQELQVLYDTGRNVELVGTLALSGLKVLFEYEPSWQKKGLELAPFQMPVQRGSFSFDLARLPGNLPGLCADSLPDGWGLLIMDRFFARKGVERHEVTPLDRLAYLGDHAMGALTYSPADGNDSTVEAIQIGTMAREAYELFAGDIDQVSPLLSKIGGSPGGARPKALIGISESGREFVSGSSDVPEGYSHWLMKFSSPVYGKLSELGPYEGIVESIYLQMAEKAGISVQHHKLILADDLLHLAVKRFDRPARDRRLHMATACGLHHADCRQPSLDYKDLIKTAWALTRDARQVEEQYRRAIFNLFAINRDDHSKNHSYLVGENNVWRLSPAYDLTYSMGPGGEHWTSYLGVGKMPSRSVLLKLADVGSISAREATATIDQVQHAVGGFSTLCKEHGVPQKTIKGILAEQEETRKAAM